MKRKMGICIVLTLLMIVSAFTISTTAVEECEHKGEIVFTKKVWDNELNEWANETEVLIGEVVKFRIEATYFMDDYYNDAPLKVYNIVITDDMVFDACCFEYVDGSASITPTSIVDNVLTWELTDVLNDTESLSIEFRALITEMDCGDPTVNVNWARLEATECGIYTHNVEDDAIVNVKYGLELEKKVWDPAKHSWEDELPEVVLDQIVKFQITVTYFGPDILKCMSVYDFLPECCLEYIGNEVFTYPDTELFEDPEITATGNPISWKWGSEKLFNLKNAQSVVITFETKVVEYCYTTVMNSGEVDAWSCEGCSHHYAYDAINIVCSPPPITFEKKVSDDGGRTWVEEVNTYVDEKVRFKLEFRYYGVDNLTDVRLVDELPCVLIYADNANIAESYVTEDRKTIWWNISGNVTDGDRIVIEFDALVTDVTGGGCVECKAINHAKVNVYEEEDCQLILVDQYTDSANVTAESNCYPYVKYISGPGNGGTGDSIEFKAKGKDQCGSDLEYWFDWGDGTNSGWIGPYASDVEVTKSNSWDTVGVYTVKVKVRDDQDAESDWSEPATTVNITKGEPDIKIAFNNKFEFKKITATITNNLDSEIKDAYWEINVQGGLLKKMNTTVNDTVNLTAGDNLAIFNNFKMLPMFGRLSIEITVDIPGYADPFKATASAVKIGPIVLLS